MEIVQSLITILAGMLAGLYAARWQNEKLSAETAKIYQEIANVERAEREKLEKSLRQEIEYLSERLSVARQELKAIQSEKEDWQKERTSMLQQIEVLSKDVRRIKRDTGQLRMDKK